MIRECPETRSGLHLWCGGHIDMPHPHCLACKTDGDLGTCDDGGQRQESRGSIVEILIWLLIGGALVYLALLALPH